MTVCTFAKYNIFVLANNINFISKTDTLFSFCGQEVNAAILEDMLRLGKQGGLKSFEQVQTFIINPLCEIYFFFLSSVHPSQHNLPICVFFLSR